LLPVVTEAGPVFEIDRSVLGVTGVDALALLLAGVGSVVVDDTVAVFTIVVGVEYESGSE
jgi:hypothetical protein